jgi:hypothetical protein
LFLYLFVSFFREKRKTNFRENMKTKILVSTLLATDYVCKYKLLTV